MTRENAEEPAAEVQDVTAVGEGQTAGDREESVRTDTSAAPRKKKKLPREVREFLIRIAATAAVVWAALTFLFGIYVCHSDTCYPMVKDGDLCVTWNPPRPRRGILSCTGMTGRPVSAG